MGRTVRSRRESGRGSIRIDRQELPAGIYFYRIQADGDVASTGKLLLGR
jgi:hypothetical protein